MQSISVVTPGVTPEDIALAAAALEFDLQRQRMALRAGALGLLLPWDGAHEVTPTPAASRLPNSAAWLRGLANVRGSLVPVVDVALAFGDTQRRRADFLLICGQGEACLGLLIDGLPRAFDIGAAQPPLGAERGRDSLPPALAACAGVMYRHDERTWIDLDPAALFDVLVREVAAA